MTNNFHDLDAPSKSFSENITTSVEYQSADTSKLHMDQYSPRRLPLKIPEMLRPNIDGSKSPNALDKNSSQIDKTMPICKQPKKLKEQVKSKQQKDFASPPSSGSVGDSGVAEGDLMLAASALEKLKGDKYAPATMRKLPKPTMASSTKSTISSTVAPKPTIFDKMISHPLISNSINYVLEKTINSSNNNILQEGNSSSSLPPINTIPPIANLTQLSYKSNTTNNETNGKRKRELDASDPLDSLNEKKRSRTSATSLTSTYPNKDFRFKRKSGNQNLRQQVAISSAVSAQKSLQDLKYLSGLNLNIESRKRLTMLIHFLKLGNSQLSERIDNLIQSVDAKRQRLAVKSANLGEGRSNSEPDINIQQIKSDIVTTVKKIVNVVSKVSAQSLSEPARSNVREALLKLPTNWATMLNNESVFSVGIDDESDFRNEDDYEDEEDDDEDEEEEEEEEIEEEVDDDEDDGEYEEAQESRISSLSPTSMPDTASKTKVSVENIPTMTVNNQTIFQRKRKPSVSRRLLTSLLRYRKTKGDGLEQNTLKVKKWFREKIKDQIMHDSSGKVLILAQESLDMVNKIIKFCNESLDKAEHWNNDRQHQHQIELQQRLQQINRMDPYAVHTKGREEAIETMVVRDTNTKNASEKGEGGKP